MDKKKGKEGIMSLAQAIGFRASLGEVVYEPETIALLARAAVQPTTALAVLINTTIKGLKDDGVFALCDCLYVRGVHEAQLACQNWIKNAHNSTLVNSPTFTPKQGFTGNGSSSYINNNYIQSTQAVNYSTTSSTIMVMSGIIGTQNARGLLGTNEGSGVKNNLIYFYTAANEIAYLNDANGYSPNNITNGAYLGYAKSGTTIKGYLNGAPSGADGTTNNRAVNTVSMFELGINLNGGIAYFYNGQIGFTFYGGYLTPAQMLALYTRIKYFYDNVGGTF